MLIDKVLYPTDFSRCSEQALDHGLFLAREFDAELHMLHALVLHEEDPNDPRQHFPEAAELLRRLSDVARSELARLAAHPRGEGVTIFESEKRGFSAGSVILEHAQEIGADLIVMGTHGRRGPSRFFLGSVAEGVVRHAHCPVLTLREQKEPRGLDAIHSVLAPVDFSEHSKAGIQAGKELAARCGARLEVLHVVELPPVPTLYGQYAVVQATERLKRHSEDALSKLVEETPGPTVEYGVHLAEGTPAHEIAAYAKKNESGLIVIPTHGLTGIEHMLIGSTAERVIRQAGCPVFTVKPFGKSLTAT